MPNLSQIKRERMLAFLQKIKDEHRDDDEMLIALGEIESELTSKKYGLVWEQHEEAVDVMMRDDIPVFTEVQEREITAAPEQGYNFILEGDNLHSLRLLEKTHKGRIDVIYIDPPYNTGGKNDFVYDDCRIDVNDSFRHSKWCSFIYKRLLVARNILSDDGLIFISIDDNEYANLKLICDSVFGEQNFVTTCVWQKIHSIKNDAKYLSVNHDYILIYAKQIEKIHINLLERTDEMNARYKNPDNDPSVSVDCVQKGIWILPQVTVDDEKKKVDKIFRGNISSVYFSENGEKILHCSSRFEEGEWVPSQRYCSGYQIENAYFDVPEYLADDLFIQHQVRVRFLREYKKDGELYTIVMCRVRKRDEERFCEALEELPRKMMLLGYADYPAYCTNAIRRLEARKQDIRSA